MKTILNAQKVFAVLFLILCSHAHAVKDKHMAIDFEGSNPNAHDETVDTYGYRTAKRPLFAPSWKGGYSRRFLRANMAPLIGSVEAQERLAEEMDSLVSNFCRRKKVKITKDEIMQGLSELGKKDSFRSDSEDVEYEERRPFADRRGTFLSGGADLAWDYFWGGGTIFVGWFRKNYRKKTTVDKRFRDLFERLEKVLMKVALIKVRLQICFNRLGNFEGKETFSKALSDIEYNGARASKIKERQLALQANYGDGNSQIVAVWESFRDYTAVQMKYLQALNSFLEKNLKSRYSALNSLPVASRQH